MQKWRQDRNFRQIENPDGAFTYVITVDGEDVEVNRTIYRDYAYFARKMEYMERELKRDRVKQDENGRAVLDTDGFPVVLPEREISLDKLMDEDLDYPSDELSPEDIVIQRLEIAALNCCLEQLDADERAIIDALFYKGKTERLYAVEIGCHFMTIHSRKVRALAKLKKLLTKI